MITPLPTKVCSNIASLFKTFSFISYENDADITINDPKNGKYNIAYHSSTEDVDEAWVDSLEEKIELQQLGVEVPIFVMTTDKELLPYCMKDRLVSIQDRINKEK